MQGINRLTTWIKVKKLKVDNEKKFAFHLNKNDEDYKFLKKLFIEENEALFFHKLNKEIHDRDFDKMFNVLVNIDYIKKIKPGNYNKKPDYVFFVIYFEVITTTPL